MNKFKAYTALSVLQLCMIVALAQPVDQQELQAAVRNINQLATGLSDELSNALKSIDVDALTRDAEKLASLSEQQARKIIHQNIAQLDGQLLAPPDASIPFGFQKEKVIEYSHPINNHTVNIDNRYGKITINNWTQNEVKIIVTLRTAEKSERKAQAALDRVHIDESRSGNMITFKTAIESGDSNWWSLLTSDGSDRTLRVDYDIYLPKKNKLVLVNRYGAIALPDRDGSVDISVSYGSLHAGRLNARGNSLAVAYSEAEVNYLNEAEVTVRYGGFTLSEAETLTLEMSSSGGKIGKINRQADISLRYSGGFEMGLGKTIQKASVAAAYSNVHIRPASDAAFTFDVAVSYGKFDYDRNRIHIGSKSESHTSASYSGYWNKAANNSVSISARYGAVSLK